MNLAAIWVRMVSGEITAPHLEGCRWLLVDLLTGFVLEPHRFNNTQEGAILLFLWGVELRHYSLLDLGDLRRIMIGQ